METGSLSLGTAWLRAEGSGMAATGSRTVAMGYRTAMGSGGDNGLWGGDDVLWDTHGLGGGDGLQGC
ncbi:hypothetical protein GUJ93_ZPchr0639g33708 [Zizania palustris]|uniref:Uncharacterized protein n=1 Tax=Zizania palustris TaxID=103762 RepID=A0A8J5UR76_ZIZPA|nr:hypothetical protein GUJ93_ZPchr0639g33708 [Zizania palustris]